MPRNSSIQLNIGGACLSSVSFPSDIAATKEGSFEKLKYNVQYLFFYHNYDYRNYTMSEFFVMRDSRYILFDMCDRYLLTTAAAVCKF